MSTDSVKLDSFFKKSGIKFNVHLRNFIFMSKYSHENAINLYKHLVLAAILITCCDRGDRA